MEGDQDVLGAATFLVGPAGPSEHVQLVSRIRDVGPFEDWRAIAGPELALPQRLMVRRPAAGRGEMSELGAELVAAFERWHAAAHHTILGQLGVLRPPSGGVLQLLELPDGIDLELASGCGRMPVSAAVWMGRQLFEALAHAHGQGVAHGALDPRCLWLLRDGEVCVDFGLAVRSRDAASTRSTDVRFTHPVWMLEPRPRPDHDVYAAAAILYWALTGQPARAHLRAPPPRSLRSEGPGLPPGIERVLLDILAAERRTPPAHEVEEQLMLGFYRDLAAEDGADGQDALLDWMGEALPPTTADAVESDGEGTSVMGSFTGAWNQFDAPVLPRELTSAGHLEAEDEDELEDAPTLHAHSMEPEASSVLSSETLEPSSVGSSVVDTRPPPPPAPASVGEEPVTPTLGPRRRDGFKWLWFALGFALTLGMLVLLRG